MFLRFCFAILALASRCFTCCYLHENRVNDRISLVIIIFEILIFIAVEYQAWEWLGLP